MKFNRMSSVLFLDGLRHVGRILVTTITYAAFSMRLSLASLLFLVFLSAMLLTAKRLIMKKGRLSMINNRILESLEDREYIATYEVTGDETPQRMRKIIFSKMYFSNANFFENIMFALSGVLLLASIGATSIYVYQLIERYIPSFYVACFAILAICFQIYYNGEAYAIFGRPNTKGVFYVTVMDNTTKGIFKVGPWHETDTEAFRYLDYIKKKLSKDAILDDITYLGINCAYDISWEEAERLNEEEKKLFPKAQK